LYQEQTSGTTGKPLRLWLSRQTVRDWFALFEARVRRWNGVSRTDRWAMLGGQLVVPVSQHRPPFWVWNAGMKQLYMSSYHLSSDTIPDYLEAMRRYGVTYLLGYASSMTTVAQTLLERGIPALPLRVAISNAEPLSDSQRERISSAFRCPVRDTYGMAEIVCGASECASGSLHLWPEAGILEILQDDRDEAAPQSAPGRVVCTGLLNADMPLVRYEVGDRGVLGSAETPCACGRLLPRLGQIEGRTDDLVVTPDGRRIGRLDPVFKADLPIREAQIVQEAVDCVRVRLVPAPGFGPSHARSVRHRLGQRLGEAVHVVVETVAEIPRGPGGKFRAVVSLLPGNRQIGGGS
jgi:phenylacetate-CoA ligase